MNDDLQGARPVEMPNGVLTTVILGNFTPFVQNSGNHLVRTCKALTILITLARIDPRSVCRKWLEIHLPGNRAPLERDLQFY